MITEKDKQILRKAIDILDTNGWTTGNYASDSGQYCAVGALTAAAGGEVPAPGDQGWHEDIQNMENSTLVIAIQDTLRSRGAIDKWDFLPDWNDRTGRTKEEVIELFTSFL